MKNRFFTMLMWDVKLQIRHHIITANIVSTALICVFIQILPFDRLPVELASFFIFADPALIGLTFVGAMVLMEKAYRVHMAIDATPSPPWIYVASKIVTFSFFGTLSGLVVAWAARGWDFHFIYMTLGLILANTFAVAVGFIMVAKSRSMNDLIVKLLIGSTILYIPAVGHFDLGAPIFDRLTWLIPSTQILEAFNAAITSIWTPSLLVHISYLTIMTIASIIYGYKAYQTTMANQE